MAKKRPLNPYQKIANLHNAGLKTIVSILSAKSGKNLSNAEIVDAICAYLASSNNQSIIDDAINYAHIAEIINKDPEADFAENLKKLELGDEARAFAQELMAISSENSAEAIEKIHQLETKVLESAIEGKQRSTLLLLLAVANASAGYWQKETGKKKSLWGKIFGKIKKLPWKADVAGAAAGLVDPLSNIVYGVTPGGLALVITKVLGGAIVASVVGYRAEAEQTAQSDQAKDDRDRLKELPKPPKLPKGPKPGEDDKK